jgi:hypothetical protein
MDRRSLHHAQSEYAIGFVLGDLDELVDLLTARRSVNFADPRAYTDGTVLLRCGGDGVGLPRSAGTRGLKSGAMLAPTADTRISRAPRCRRRCPYGCRLNGG